jgi:hypothetical protein
VQAAVDKNSAVYIRMREGCEGGGLKSIEVSERMGMEQMD